MGLLRGAREPFPPFEAVVSFHFVDDNLDALAVRCEGDAEMLKHLPSAYFDKALHNARRLQGVADDLLARATWVWERASGELTEETVYVSAVTVYDGTEVPPDASVVIKLSGALDTKRIGAETRFSPLKASNPSAAEFALWAIWDWTVANIGDWEDVDTLIQRMLWQCSHYQSGIPGIRDLGRAPFLSAEAFELLPSA